MHNLLDNSYIKNATVKQTAQGNALYIDSWKDRNAYRLPIVNSTVDGRYWGESDSNIIVGENSSFGILYLKGDSTGGSYVELTNCTYTSVDFTGNKGTGRLTVYTAPDCINAGTKTVYDIDNTSGVLDSTYEAPALGHEADLNAIESVAYNSGYLANGTYTCGCVRCDATGISEKTPSAPALFEFKGFSTPEKQGVFGIVMSYISNKDAIKAFEDLGNTIEYGTVAAAKSNLNESNPLDESGNAVELEKGVVVKAKLDNSYSGFDFKISNIAEDQKDIELVIATYVIANGKVVYLQRNNQLENGLTAYSYNTVPKAEE